MNDSEDFGTWWNNEHNVTLPPKKNSNTNNEEEEMDADLLIADACSTIVSYRNSYYDQLGDVYQSDYSKNFLLKNVLVMDAASKALKGAQDNLKSLQRFHNDFRLRLSRAQDDIVCMMKRWWQLFMQEIEQNKLIASRHLAKHQTGAPYSWFSQYADQKHGQKLCKEENNLLKEIAVAIDKYIL